MKSETIAQQAITAFTIQQEVSIAAPIEIAFESIIAQLDAECEMPDGSPFPMKFEAWPGGRWFRDLGHNAGHLWGHVQVIKPPKLIEICGPLMMSFAATNHVQYRLTAEGAGTLLAMTHRAMGVIDDKTRGDMTQGWTYWIEHIRKQAEAKAKK